MVYSLHFCGISRNSTSRLGGLSEQLVGDTTPQLFELFSGATVWQPGMAEWARGLDTPPFRDHILALTSSWFALCSPNRIIEDIVA